MEDNLFQQKVSVKWGLAHAAVQSRLEKDGFKLIAITAMSRWKIFPDQCNETMEVVLIFAAAISALSRDWKDAIAILIIVALNAVLGFVQEYRAERAMQALTRVTAPILILV